jgi:hypothetical protein
LCSPFLVLTLLFALASCDSSFDPIAPEKTDFFAVFGLRDTLEPSGEPEAIQVVSTRLATGAEVVWQDSLIRLDDGQPGRLFFATIPVEPGDRYQLEVRGAGGAATRVVTQVPPRIRIAPQPIAPGFNQDWAQRVTLLGQALLPFRVDLSYAVTPPQAAEPVRLTAFFLGEAPSPSGVQVVVNLEAHREEILTRLGLPHTDSTVVLNSLSLEIDQVSAEWGRVDTAEQSGTVENGFGTFASVARYTVAWTLDASDLRLVGYKEAE